MPTRRPKQEQRAETPPRRNDAQLNCVSLRFQLDCAVTCGAVKGQEERRCQGSRGTLPFGGALDSPASHHRTSRLTSQNKLLRRAATSALTFMTFS